MSYKGIKSKILRLKRIFTEHWSTFVASHHRYDTDYYQTEISKMLTCGSEAGGFAIFQCLRCGEGEHKVHFSCKGNARLTLLLLVPQLRGEAHGCNHCALDG